VKRPAPALLVLFALAAAGTLSVAHAAPEAAAKPASGSAALTAPASTPAKPSNAKPEAVTVPAAKAPAKSGPDSLAILEKAVARDSTKFDNLYRLGVMYLDRDRISEASTVLLKASKLRPRDHRVLVNLGAAYDAAGHSDQA